MRKTILYAFISCSILFFTFSAAGTEDLLDEYENDLLGLANVLILLLLIRLL